MSVASMAAKPLDQRTPMLIIGLLFFIFGFVTWMNGPLIQFVELAFELDTVNAFLVLMVFYLSYFFLALPAAVLLRRSGMKNGMAIGLLVMAAGAIVFGEFAVRRWYPGALGGLFVIGAGLAFETGSALLDMGIAGGAIIPQGFALLREHYDFQLVFMAIMVTCYLYILFYALRGHRAGQPARAI